jgi:hypothetical protein
MRWRTRKTYVERGFSGGDEDTFVYAILGREREYLIASAFGQ